MSILSINVNTTGLVGDTVNPRRNTMVTTDNLATVTTAGYLNGENSGGNPILPTDVFHIIYSYNPATQAGTFGIFTVSYSAATGFTLTLWENPGNVLLPVVSGDFPIFNGTTGQIKDSGLAPSSTSSQLFVVTTPGSLTSGNFPLLNDTHGTLNTGRAPSSSTAGYKVVMSPGSLTAGNLVKLADVNGTIADQGVAMKSVAQAAVAGGAAAQTVSDAFCTSASCVIASWNDTTNAVSIQKVAAGNGSFVVTSSGDPGASHLNYVIFK